MIEAWRGRHRYDPNHSLQAWLLTIVRNVCYTRLRESRRDGKPEAFDDEMHGTTYDPAEANAELEKLAPQLRAHPDVLKVRWLSLVRP